MHPRLLTANGYTIRSSRASQGAPSGGEAFSALEAWEGAERGMD